MATSGPYPLGAVIRMSNQTLVNGSPADPGSITLHIKTPDGNVADISGSIVHDGTGLHHADFVTTQAGYHYYRFVTTGTGQSANEASFAVLPQETQ